MTLTLPWMDAIRARLKEHANWINVEDLAYEEMEVVKEFIKPIIEYGEAEEKRIEKEMKEWKI